MERPTSGAPTIVVGAGAIGCWAAWHLRQRGRQVTLIDAAATPASQSTQGAAGFVAAWSAIHVEAWDATELEMQRYGLERYRALAQQSAEEIGFFPCGIVYIYLQPSAWQQAQGRIARARQLGTRLEILDSSRAAALVPQVRFERVAGIVYDPDAVRLRAGDAIRHLASDLAAHGVRCAYRTQVRGFLYEGSQIVGVETDRGPFRAAQTIIAAGAWSRPLLRQLGVACPAEPCVETRFLTRPLPGITDALPLLIFADCHGFYIRAERNALLIGGGDDEPTPTDRFVDADAPPWVSQLPPDQAYRIRHLLREAEAAMPILAQAEVETITSGLPTFTTDQRFIIDRVAGFDGLSLASACQEAGVTHGPALGRMLAEIALDEPPTWDREPFRLTRFALA